MKDVTRLRAVDPGLALGHLTYGEATVQFRSNYKAARAAYIDLLGTTNGYRMLDLLDSTKAIGVPALRATRDEAQRVATEALAVVSALNAAVDACERSQRPTPTNSA